MLSVRCLEGEGIVLVSAQVLLLHGGSVGGRGGEQGVVRRRVLCNWDHGNRYGMNPLRLYYAFVFLPDILGFSSDTSHPRNVKNPKQQQQHNPKGMKICNGNVWPVVSLRLLFTQHMRRVANAVFIATRGQ